MTLFKLAIAAGIALSSTCAGYQISVKSSGGNATSPTQYGIMHEDINNSGDGGMYAELIRNRAFQGSLRYPTSLDGWSALGGSSLALKNLSMPLSSALPTSMNVASSSSSGMVGFSNAGYWGMDVKIQKYTGSFWVKGAYDGVFTAALQSKLTDESFGSVQVASKSKSSEWTEHAFTLTPTKSAPSSNNTFSVTFDSASAKDGSLDFNLISLFPPTWNNRPNGLRIDLMETLAELKPTFFRFPGGNMLEGNDNKTLWRWNETIGPLRGRPGFPGVWGYQQTNGLGLVEYMLWSEDLKCEPVLAVWDGLALNGDITPPDKIQIFVQDALDELEFLLGDVSTTYGALRASYGYPKPWSIKYVEIGNEDWLAGRPAGWDSYKQYRFKAFLDAINAKYPEIKVLSSGSVFDNFTIPAPGGGDFHDYNTPDGFVSQFGFFDQLTTDSVTLIGEAAAVHPNGGIAWDGDLMPFPWWSGAVSEAVFLLGIERNSNKIPGATYAPGFRNLNRWQWSVTLVQHAADPALTTRSTSWYVWQLLGTHLMTHTLPTTSGTSYGPLYYAAGKNADSNSHIFKAAVFNSTNGADVPVSVGFEGVKAGAKAQLTVLTGPENPYGFNDPFTRVNVVKTSKQIVTAGADGSFTFGLPNLSVAVLDSGITSCKKRRRTSTV